MDRRGGGAGGRWGRGERPGRPERSTSIARKLAAVMAALLVAVIVVLGLEVRQIGRDAATVRRQTALAVSADGPSRLLIDLQNERSWAAVAVVGLGDQVELIVEGDDETRRRTDAALTGFEARLAERPPETRRAFAPAVEGLASGLASVRRTIDRSRAPRTLESVALSEEVFDRYTELVEPFFTGIADVAQAIDQPELRRGAELLELATRQVETLGMLARALSLTSLLSPGGIDEGGEIVEVGALWRRFTDLADQIGATSTGVYAAAGDDDLYVGFTEAMSRQVDAALDGDFVIEELLATISPSQEGTYLAYRERVATILRDRAERSGDAAARRERAHLALVGLTAVTALVLMVTAARAVTRPLRSLAAQVRATAREGLPQAVAAVLQTPTSQEVVVPAVDAVAVQDSGEIGELAEVINTVHRAVVGLAVEQAILRRNLADSFVSLGRRNQNLLTRQLDLITRLQRHEIDPSVLDHLFRLDHLATRMRRNAESLLVLTGDEPPRRWQAPVRMLDIVRAALSEVEDYQRVVLRIVEPFTVLGSAAADVAHLLAELIENALAFSPQDAPVEVSGLLQPAGYSLAISDAGVGMPPAEIARANRRLAGAELLTVAPSRYIGHYVAGNLAARHGIRVRLQRSAGPGITAIAALPLSISR